MKGIFVRLNSLESSFADSGTIDAKELRTALQTLGHTPSDEDLYVMMSQVVPIVISSKHGITCCHGDWTEVRG